MDPKERRPKEPEVPEAEAPEAEVQQGTGRGISRNERVKRVIKQHPRRDIPRVESVEPPEAPPKE